MIVVLLVVFYFFLIRPENKKKKKLEQMRNEVKVGDEITTIGGMLGKVVNVRDDTITFETGEDRVRIQIARWAISNTGYNTQN
ncbi:MAG: preprotein translocase subunit YajC [Oscillospiraceae bacterium]|jgi:preprotein translocase subunit YajC|nr:preprotein translocase subunit YajC [Oscillospiraceae bacterium]